MGDYVIGFGSISACVKGAYLSRREMLLLI